MRWCIDLKIIGAINFTAFLIGSSKEAANYWGGPEKISGTLLLSDGKGNNHEEIEENKK